MTEKARVSKGVPAGGEFAATVHAEPYASLSGTSVRPIRERLSDLNTALAGANASWEAEKAELNSRSEDMTTRRRRLAGARTAARLLEEFPYADTLYYTRDPQSGITTFRCLEDKNGYTLCDDEDMDRPAHTLNPKEMDKRVAVRQAVRSLTGATQPPGHEAQGITVHGDSEQLHLPTAVDDALAILDEDEDLTPEQASAERMDAAMGQWLESDDYRQEAVRDMLTDLRHYADRHGIDLDRALNRSYTVYLQESHDPAFKEGF